jgi:hypothetical protein
MSLVDLSTQRIAQRVEISVFKHATEDRANVLKSVQNLFPKNSEFPNYNETNLSGYFGDPIIRYLFLVKHRRLATNLLDNIVKNLSSLDFVALLDELPQRIDETKNLYLRLDKQKAFLGKFVLEKHDSIRVKVNLLVPHKVDPANFLRDYLEAKRK